MCLVLVPVGVFVMVTQVTTATKGGVAVKCLV